MGSFAEFDGSWSTLEPGFPENSTLYDAALKGGTNLVNRPASDTLKELNRYIEKGVAPHIAPSLNICFELGMDPSFNAAVSTWNHRDFKIVTETACAVVLEFCMDRLEDNDILEVQRNLADKLFASEAHSSEVTRLTLHFALIFILLHELSHIICGHLKFGEERNLVPRLGETYHIDEILQEQRDGQVREKSVPADWVKLMELEADMVAFELLQAISFDLMSGGDSFAELLPEDVDPEHIPGDMQKALDEIVISACASVFYIMEMQRGGSTTHPLPRTRLHNILYVWTRRLFVEDDIPSGMSYVPLTPDTRHELNTRILPTAYNAAEFGIGCAENFALLEPNSSKSKDRIITEKDLLDGVIDSFLVTETNGINPEIEEFLVLLPQISELQSQLTRYPIGRRQDES